LKAGDTTNFEGSRIEGQKVNYEKLPKPQKVNSKVTEEFIDKKH
jgi:hypothetical protein